MSDVEEQLTVTVIHLECGHPVEMLELFRFDVRMLMPPTTDNSLNKRDVKARPLILSLNRQQVFSLSNTNSIRAVPGCNWRPRVRFV